MKKILILNYTDISTNWFRELAEQNNLSLIFVESGENLEAWGNDENIESLKKLCKMKAIKFVDL